MKWLFWGTLGVAGTAIALVILLHQFGEAVEYHLAKWQTLGPRLSPLWRRRRVVVRRLFAVLILGSVTVGGLWWWAERQGDVADRPIVITDVQFVPPMVLVPDKPATPGMHIAYRNRTGTPVVVAWRARIEFSPETMADAQARAAQDGLLAWGGWGGRLEEEKDRPVAAGAGRYFSLPTLEDLMMQLFRDEMPNVVAGKKRLYVFVTLMYRNQSMPDGTVGVTEECMWFLINDARHVCGRSRTILHQLR